ncbi:unnamed protein product [Paramecium octaurelia]|uniref:Uncharacterized protein n=1 Tax=Paramecium octaurelia TaxID=43137 RepID=A0A8S1WMB3_PAROT|nr:unnamed protein product [Paramecium octaurelia]
MCKQKIRCNQILIFNFKRIQSSIILVREEKKTIISQYNDLVKQKIIISFHVIIQMEMDNKKHQIKQQIDLLSTKLYLSFKKKDQLKVKKIQKKQSKTKSSEQLLQSTQNFVLSTSKSHKITTESIQKTQNNKNLKNKIKEQSISKRIVVLATQSNLILKNYFKNIIQL